MEVLIVMSQESEGPPWTVPVQPESLFQSLRGETQEILWRTSQTTGKRIWIIPDPLLNARALLEIARPEDSWHTLRYKEDLGQFLDHLVAHECGHLLRLWTVPPSERMLWSSPMECRKAASDELGGHLDFLYATRMIKRETLEALLTSWWRGLVSQVGNYPIDMKIERWLFETYPSLQQLQADTLKSQLEENYWSLNPEIEAVTPKLVYENTMAMNCAFAHFIAEMMGGQILVRPYPERFFEKAAHLLSLFKEESEDNHRGDVRIIKRWAETLGISNWYVWKDWEGLQK